MVSFMGSVAVYEITLKEGTLENMIANWMVLNICWLNEINYNKGSGPMIPARIV